MHHARSVPDQHFQPRPLVGGFEMDLRGSARPGPGRRRCGSDRGRARTGPRCGFHQTRTPGTKYRARFGADVDELVALIRAEKPDAVVATRSRRPSPSVRHCWKLDRTRYWPGAATTWRFPSTMGAAPARPVRCRPGAPCSAGARRGPDRLRPSDGPFVHGGVLVSAAASCLAVGLGETLRIVPAPRDNLLVRPTPTAGTAPRSVSTTTGSTPITAPDSSSIWPTNSELQTPCGFGARICSAAAATPARVWTTAWNGRVTNSPPCLTSRSCPTAATASATKA